MRTCADYSDKEKLMFSEQLANSTLTKLNNKKSQLLETQDKLYVALDLLVKAKNGKPFKKAMREYFGL